MNVFSVTTMMSPNKHPSTLGVLAGRMGAAQPCPTCLLSPSWPARYALVCPWGRGSRQEYANTFEATENC